MCNGQGYGKESSLSSFQPFRAEGLVKVEYKIFLFLTSISSPSSNFFKKFEKKHRFQHLGFNERTNLPIEQFERMNANFQQLVATLNFPLFTFLSQLLFLIVYIFHF